MHVQTQSNLRGCCDLSQIYENEDEPCVSNGFFALVVFFVVVLTEIAVVIVYKIARGTEVDSSTFFGSLMRQGAFIAFGCVVAVTLTIVYKRITENNRRRREDTIRIL